MVDQVSNIASLAAAGNAASSSNTRSGASGGIAGNFDQFLTLLTTQLRNQNPLDPLDTNQFTQQLVQFAGVEQQLKTNDALSNLLTANNRSAAISSALGFVGANVTYDSSTTQLQSGRAAWNISSPQLGSATFEILNSSGAVVQSFANVTINAGQNPFSWNGRQANGQTAADGSYTLRVTARNAKQESLTTSIESSGIVDSADITGAAPLLKIGSNSIALSAVKSIRRN